MKNIVTLLSAIIFFFSYHHLQAQDLEVAGKAKIATMDKVNTADSVVVRLSDGTLAVRDVTSLMTETGWVMVADTITTNKYVGIGTASPDEMIHIIGNQKIEGIIEIIQAIGDSSVFIGANTGSNDDGAGNYNTGIGVNALRFNTTGFYNTASGSSTLESNTTGSYNTASGLAALVSNTTGDYNTAIGVAALLSNKANSRNTAIGRSAMRYADDRATGRRTLNTAIGYEALRGSTTATANTGIYNTAIGAQTLLANTTGGNNTASGNFALYSNTTGSSNTASGHQALFSNTTAVNNTASGNQALVSNTTGYSNTASGNSALNSNTTGYSNTASGEDALSNNTTGSNNTAIGVQANVDTTAGQLMNATALGYGAIVDASNKVRIGNGSVLTIEGNVAFSPSSDRRLKEDITPVSLGIDFINDLNPVQYHRINNTHEDVEMGVIAQELLVVLAKHGLDQSGMVNQPKISNQYMSVRYNDLLPPMIKAIQELSEENQQLKSALYQLMGDMAMIKSKLLPMVENTSED